MVLNMRSDLDKKCNICGGSSWTNMHNREGVKCAVCGSLERTRVLMMWLTKLGIPKPEQKVLHFAPEKGLAKLFTSIVGKANYQAYDLEPKRYSFFKVKKFDLCVDVQSLSEEQFDLIVHSHVLEHVPCNYTAVLYGLHKALKSSGIHICCIPITSGFYDETTADIGDEQRRKRFGQFDHVRRFGRNDINKSLGMVFDMPVTYNLEDHFEKQDLDKYNIPNAARKGWSPHSILVFKKSDIKLR